MMNHIRPFVVAAASAAVLIAGLGAAAVGAAATASADTCWESYDDGSVYYWDC